MCVFPAYTYNRCVHKFSIYILFLITSNLYIFPKNLQDAPVHEQRLWTVNLTDGSIALRQDMDEVLARWAPGRWEIEASTRFHGDFMVIYIIVIWGLMGFNGDLMVI